MPLALRVTRILVVPRLYTSQTYVTAVLECYYYYYFFLNILVAVCVLRIFDLYACTRRVRVCTTHMLITCIRPGHSSIPTMHLHANTRKRRAVVYLTLSTIPKLSSSSHVYLNVDTKRSPSFSCSISDMISYVFSPVTSGIFDSSTSRRSA